MQPISSSPAAPAATTGRPHRRWRPALLAKLGGAAAAAGLLMIILAGAMAPKTDADRLRYMGESVTGGARPTLLEGLVTLGSLALVVGLVVVVSSGVWAVARAAAPAATSR